VTEAYAKALQTIIGEFKNISPQITNAFIFNANGEIVASDESTIDEQSKNLITAYNGISSKAEVIDSIKTATVQGTDRQLSITCMNNQCLTTVFSRDADEKIMKSLTCVVVPTVVGLMDELSKSGLPETAEPEDRPIEEEILPNPDPLPEESIPEETEPATYGSEPPLPEPPATQFMVEKIGGLLVAPDTVRVNSEVIAKWVTLYGNKKITEIHIETLEGKTITCKFKAVKEANNNTRGEIQIPERILQTLQTSKGKLVIVKPVIT
jgi:hypothetical protein